MESELLQRITLNPNVSSSKPTIRNMRYPFEVILDLLSAGMSAENILACLLFASKLVKVNSINKVLAA